MQIDDAERRRPKAKTWFRVLDARDFKDISTVELQRPLYDLAIDTKNSLLSAIEGRYLDADSSTDDDTTCRLYEIGRKRPSEDDSDVEEGLDGSDTMDDDEFDDESDTEGDDEEEDDDDVDDDDDFEDYDEEEDDGDDGIEYIGDDRGEEYGSNDEDEDEDGGSDASDDDAEEHGRPLSRRDIQLLFELPDGDYYDIHDDYSSDGEDDDEA